MAFHTVDATPFQEVSRAHRTSRGHAGQRRGQCAIMLGRLINRIKVVVLALFAVYWVVTVGILVAARPVFDQVAKLGGDQRPAEVGAELVLTALLTLLSLGTLRGWRWTFWLILIAFLASILRVPIAVLEIAGKAPNQGPVWYSVFTVAVALTQFGIALAMVAGYRKAGIWGDL